MTMDIDGAQVSSAIPKIYKNLLKPLHQPNEKIIENNKKEGFKSNRKINPLNPEY